MSIEKIYRTYVDDLYSYALYMGMEKDLAMDAIHDVIYKLLVKQERLDDIKNIKFYLFRAIRNRLTDYHTHSNRFDKTSLDTYIDLPFIIKVNVEDVLIQEEEKATLKQKMEDLLDNLSNRQKEIIYLRFTQNCDYDEIADIMGISVPASRNLLFKALKELRKNNSLYVHFLLFLLSEKAVF